MDDHRRGILTLAALTIALAACGPGATAGWGTALGVMMALGISWRVGGGEARSGPPMPCTGYEVTTCNGKRLVKNCCPRGAKCNYRNPAHIKCGHGTCVQGNDPGMCPSPKPVVTPAKTKADCRTGNWAKACIDRKVTEACIMSVPTNYMGPGMNPVFQTCGADRCTTHKLLEDCFPTKKELGKTKCDGKWEKVCLAGKVEDRCVPKAHLKTSLPAKTYMSCKDGSCAVGSDAGACRGR